MDIALYTNKKRVIVLGMATTGVQPNDRIVTLGAVRLEGDELQRQSLYLIFDPRKDSHPEAAEIHGYDDWITRFQDLFSHLAPRIRSWLSWADELVMHDAAFNFPYLQREFRKAKLERLDQPTFCTMERAREVWGDEAKSLDDCLKRIERSRIYRVHGALEDAYLTAALYLQQIGSTRPIARVNSWYPPTNLKLCPPRPIGQLLRRPARKRVVDGYERFGTLTHRFARTD